MSPILDHLRALVACDTQNPPRHIEPSAQIFEYLRGNLPGFEVELTDEGDGCVSLLAQRGAPRLLINAHLDTVPADPGWERDPFELLVEPHSAGHRAVGLGTCDIKGAAAALLVAARESAGDVALLFTTDEEYGHSVCLSSFLNRRPALLENVDLVVVTEPTSCRAVLAHRGYARGAVRFEAAAGHSADARGLADNAVHQLGRWLAQALEVAEAAEMQGALGMTGLRFNCGQVGGGTADNVIASAASAEFSMRPPPGVDADQAMSQLGGPEASVEWAGPAFPDQDASARVALAGDRAKAAGIELADPVDFWTEASLFSAAGFIAFVCGPGDIERAHTAGEWVSVDQLEQAVAVYRRLIGAAA